MCVTGYCGRPLSLRALPQRVAGGSLNPALDGLGMAFPQVNHLQLNNRKLLASEAEPSQTCGEQTCLESVRLRSG